MKLRHVFLAALALLLPCAVPGVRACQCRERQPPCAQYWEADAVFIGSVTTIALPDAPGRVDEGAVRERINFDVERALRGVKGRSVEIVNSGTSCDFGFKPGIKYLVYAYRNPTTGTLSTYYCSRTAELSKAASDLSYINKLPASAPEMVITGVLADGQKTLSNVMVTAENGGRLYRSASNRAGWFTLAVPRTGKYKVRIFLPHNVDVAGTSDLTDKISGVMKTRRHYVVEYQAEVKAGGCTFIDVPLFISGRGAAGRRARW
jgi:hypothetical protein